MEAKKKKIDVASPAAYHGEQLKLVVDLLEKGKQEATEYHAQNAYNFYSKTLKEAAEVRSYFIERQTTAPSGEGEESVFRKRVEVAHRFYTCYEMSCDCRQCHRTNPCTCNYAYCSYCNPRGRRPLQVQEEKVAVPPKPDLSIKVTEEDLNKLPLSEAHAHYRKYVDDVQEVEGEALKPTFWERMLGDEPKRALVRTATPQAQVVMAWRNHLPARLQKLFEIYDEGVLAGLGEKLKKEADRQFEQARQEEAKLEEARETKAQEETLEAYQRRLELAAAKSPLDLRELKDN